MAEDTQQLNDLTQLYASFSETELRNLAGTLGDLTEVAQQALKSEFTRRGLTLPAQAGARQHVDESALQVNADESLKNGCEGLHVIAAAASDV